MKVIIAGSRSIKDYYYVVGCIVLSKFTITEVVSGGAMGVDRLGEEWAIRNDVPVKRFLPDWSLGKAAGIIRNKEMVDYADALIAVWDGESKGTKSIIELAKKKGMPVYVHERPRRP